MRDSIYFVQSNKFILAAVCLVTGGCGVGCSEPQSEASVASVSLEIVADGLTAPLGLVPVPDQTGRLFVVEQTGTIRIIDADGELRPEPFLDISDELVGLNQGYDERGLLGLAFHPDYAQNGEFFVYYSAPLRSEGQNGFDHTSHLAMFQVLQDDPNRADPDSESLLLQVDQPQSNHNGGQITFGPDGYLYIPLGDGGDADDTGLGHAEDWYDVNEGGNGQDIEQNLLGSILRIDVDGGEPYAIPPDNPFVDDEDVADEIWAYGLRNPFGVSFDSGGKRQLFVGDVGQNLWEEVDIVDAGGNYGWNVKEGAHCFSTKNPNESLDSCPDTDSRGEPLIDPILEYRHANQDEGLGISVIGGYVYRGAALDQLRGRYVFGDFSKGWGAGDGTLLLGSPPTGTDGAWTLKEVAVRDRSNGRIGEFVRAFGRDQAGELYVLTADNLGPSGDSGKVYRLTSGS
ncbi:PQQ-dependent sugar dehydrogenase [Enhygromyxa salina]|uniref:Soluble aldose sugar dehydrogenase YliI n=1 Tax=Enhygromyxa salina TaxID=215803 RepID=A0A2S9XUQ9_9BACT|nr:PQQ-dependent sugar dehydrogenase [Enhygromyxa salina]PRP96451.1 Soluble aldose sugar dehydrogenase YliI precursor [Enhygromyxa salina]